MPVSNPKLVAEDPQKLYLGQDLMRDALEAGSLAPFDAPRTVMIDDSEPMTARIDAYRAIRFGMAGLILHGHASRLLEPLPEPVEMNGMQVGYRFANQDGFPAPDQEYLDLSWMDEDALEKVSSCGARALLVVEQGLARDLATYIEEPEQQVGSIAITSVLGQLADDVNLAEAVGVYGQPDEYTRLGAILFEQTFPLLPDEVRDSAVIADNIVSASGNPIRFTLPGIVHVMQQSDVLLRAGEPAEVVQANADTAINGIMLHAARVSQQLFGASRIIALENLSTMQANRQPHLEDGELGWSGKYGRLPRVLPPDRDPLEYAAEVKASVSPSHRQKCPIGYTVRAGDTMPIHAIYQAVRYYMKQYDVDTVTGFSKPFPAILAENIT